MDVRLHNKSQLAGFAKAEDLAYFLKKIGNISYQHMPILAPEEEMLSEYRKGNTTWEVYAKKFTDLMEQRKIESHIAPSFLNDTCLLCSEDTPHHCHRRLVCEYLNQRWNNALLVRHL